MIFGNEIRVAVIISPSIIPTSALMAGDPPIPKRQRAGVGNDAAIGLGSDEPVEQGSGTMRKVSDSEIMKRSEVARLLRCSEPHVVALIEREGLPAFRLGKLWRFSRSEVIAWCERRSNGRRTA